MKILDLNCDYSFDGEQPEGAALNLSRNLLSSIIQSSFPQGMDSATTLAWASVVTKTQSTKDGKVELTDEEFNRVYDLCKSAQHVPINFLMAWPAWMNALEEARYPKPEAAPEEAAG